LFVIILQTKYILFMFLCLHPSRGNGGIDMKMFVFAALMLLALPVFAENATVQENSTGNDSIQGLENVSLGNVSDVQINDSQVGAVPGDFTYGFKRFFERVGEFLTFDQAGKARKHAEFGLLRAYEAHVLSGRVQKLIAQNRSAEANQTLTDIQNLVKEQNDDQTQAENEIEGALSDGTANQTQSDEVKNYTRHSIVVLQRVLAKAPEQARGGLMSALNNSINNYERHEERVRDRLEQRLARVNDRLNNTNGVEARINDWKNKTNETENETGHGFGNNKTNGNPHNWGGG
jgi:hypothetical protein